MVSWKSEDQSSSQSAQPEYGKGCMRRELQPCCNSNVGRRSVWSIFGNKEHIVELRGVCLRPIEQNKKQSARRRNGVTRSSGVLKKTRPSLRKIAADIYSEVSR